MASPEANATVECGRDLKEAYIYGTVGILVISLLSLVGALVLPCLRRNSRDKWMQVFVALAVSTMVGDAMLHLIPETLGVHSHAHGERNVSCRTVRRREGLEEYGHLGEGFRFSSHEDPGLHDHDHDHQHDEMPKNDTHFDETAKNALASVAELFGETSASVKEAEHEGGEEGDRHGGHAEEHDQRGVQGKQHDPSDHPQHRQKDQQEQSHRRQDHRERRAADEGHDHSAHEGHGHGEEDAHQDHDDHDDAKAPLIKMGVVFGAMYLFFLFESIASGVANARKGRKKEAAAERRASSVAPGGELQARQAFPPLYHQDTVHSSQAAPYAVQAYNHPTYGHQPQRALVEAYAEAELPSGYYASTPVIPYGSFYDPVHAPRVIYDASGAWYAPQSGPYALGVAHVATPPPAPVPRPLPAPRISQQHLKPTAEKAVERGHGHAHSAKEEEPELCCGFKAVAWLILVGDAVHNVADGIAVGAAFVTSNSSGLSTLVAVACHELPHEIGDFAVLLDSGLGVYKALFLNFLSALSAFGGLYLGIHLGDNDEVRPWLFALAAGMFLYVGLVDMLAHLKGMGAANHWALNVALQNLGLLLGFAIIFTLGWFEDKIRI